MVKRFLLTATLALGTALPAAAETITAEIARAGLGPTEARLAGLATPTEEERLALGAVQFLRAIEGSFQTRWTYGLTDRTGLLPLLRIGLQDNPAPTPLEPGVIAQIFREAEAGLAASITTLNSLPDGSSVALEIGLGDLWFDINRSAARDPGEGLVEVIGAASFGADPGAAAPPALPTVRFDSADARWLAAYAHLLSGMAEIVLAYDPTEPITRVLTARQTMTQWGTPPPSYLTGMAQVPDEIDIIAMVLAALEQTPDTARLASAHGHFLAMITENRRFWAAVDLETDNAMEWLPNARQTSALGVILPPETGAVWQAVLADAEALLQGEKLIPYWRIGDGGGVNLKLLFTDPRPVDVAGWVQGWAALPYLQGGPLVSAESWARFENMMMGDAMLFALWLN